MRHQPGRYILAASFTLLSACGQLSSPQPMASVHVIEAADARRVAALPGVQLAIDWLEARGARVDLSAATAVQDAAWRGYRIPTDRPGLVVVMLETEAGSPAVSLARIEPSGEITVNDFQSGFVGRVDRPGTPDARLVASGYARPSGTVESLFEVPSRRPLATDPIVLPASPGLPQCTGSVPSSLLMTRAQAQSDVQSYQEQLAIAVAAVAASGAAMAISCGATTVTVGVSAPACVVAIGLFAKANADASEATRKRNDASIRAYYAQMAIDQWKSSFAASSGCSW